MTIETRTAEPVAEPKVKTVADVLRHAALIIEERGWTQGTYDQGGFCIKGALGQALGGSPLCHMDSDADKALTDYMIDAYSQTPIYFNDTPGRAAAEVTAALRSAADAAEAAP